VKTSNQADKEANRFVEPFSRDVAQIGGAEEVVDNEDVRELGAVLQMKVTLTNGAKWTALHGTSQGLKVVMSTRATLTIFETLQLAIRESTAMIHETS
jgi:hypothetical protein